MTQGDAEGSIIQRPRRGVQTFFLEGVISLQEVQFLAIDQPRPRPAEVITFINDLPHSICNVSRASVAGERDVYESVEALWCC
jgi:hypothetical protein